MEIQEGHNRKTKKLEKESKVKRFTLPDFKTYHKATAINTVWY
jgi:5-methylcytosine-specific restriction endonuclease McrA